MIAVSLLTYLFFLCLLLVVHRLAHRAMGAPVSVGDESAYIEAGRLPDPYYPKPFLRVPFMAWLSKQSHRFSSDPARTLRTSTRFASMLTILICMLCAQLLAGINAALIIGVLLTIMPGRLVLSNHIWPDIWLGLWLSFICLILLSPDFFPELRLLLLGLFAALAFMTRFDALLLAPFIGISIASLTGLQWLLIMSPMMLAFAFLSVRNAWRYQIPWPDDTWMFNLMISASEAKTKRAGEESVKVTVGKAFKIWKSQSNSNRSYSSLSSLRQLLARPVRTFNTALLRVWASFGPDSFVLDRLLPPAGKAYTCRPVRFLRGLQIALVVAFPIFISLTLLAFLVARPGLPVIFWPSMALAVTGLLHSRTRYRQAWLPGAALLFVGAISEPGFWQTLLSSESIVYWMACISLAVALIRFRVRPETRNKT